MKLLDIIFYFTLFVTVSACGLKYEPQVTPEQKQINRQRVIEAKIAEEFQEKKLNYVSIAFGETVVLKPNSFQRLDSLFARKYELEQQGETDKFLDERIAQQRWICQNDTNEILYLEEHVFCLENGNIAEVYTGQFSLNKNNVLRDVEFTESLSIPVLYIELYKTFTLGESFLYKGFDPEQRDLEFYGLYKPRLAQLSGKDKEKFLENTLRIMEIAGKRKHLETQKILMDLTRFHVVEKSVDFKDEVFESIEQISLAADEIAGYKVVYKVKTPTISGQWEERRITLEFDPWLVLLSKTEQN